MSHTTAEPSIMPYNNPSLIKFVSWLVLGGSLNSISDSLSQIRPNQRERAETEEKGYLNSFLALSVSPIASHRQKNFNSRRKMQLKCLGRKETEG